MTGAKRKGRPAWAPERIAALRRLWREGYSASMVAQELGVSRNAVLGRVYRMGLARNGSKPVVTKPLPTQKARPVREKSPLAPVNTMWGVEENKRRSWFAQRAAAGARKALEAIGHDR